MFLDGIANTLPTRKKLAALRFGRNASPLMICHSDPELAEGEESPHFLLLVLFRRRPRRQSARARTFSAERHTHAKDLKQ
jgi:hypothetical protein